MSLCDTSDADNWIYVGEGNLNLIVRYIGDDLKYKGKVLRVRKNNEGHNEESTTFKQQFMERVIQPLLGADYIVPMLPINTSVEFLQRLAVLVEPYRPASRIKRHIVIESPVSFLLNDLTQIWPSSPTMTFELKPKWGFKPDSLHITSSNSTIKRSYCRFCIHSHLKGVAQNNFCTLDLYSMDRLRIKEALNVLLKENPQEKTLKVSINGNSVPLGSNTKTLLSTFMMDGDDTLMQDILENVIMHDPILKILKDLQMQLDELDVEGIFSLYQQREDLQSLVVNDIRIWEQVVKRFQDRRDGTCDTNGFEEQKQRICEYVLSMTFKDCSLMINVTPTSSQHNSSKIITLENGLSFRYDVKVIDTDLKSIDKIPYWFELDQSIVKHAIETNFQKDSCI